MSWVAVDGYTAATMLGISAQDGYANMPDAFTWSNAFFGLVPGSIGETSTCCNFGRFSHSFFSPK